MKKPSKQKKRVITETRRKKRQAKEKTHKQVFLKTKAILKSTSGMFISSPKASWDARKKIFFWGNQQIQEGYSLLSKSLLSSKVLQNREQFFIFEKL